MGTERITQSPETLIDKSNEVIFARKPSFLVNKEIGVAYKKQRTPNDAPAGRGNYTRESIADPNQTWAEFLGTDTHRRPHSIHKINQETNRYSSEGLAKSEKRKMKKAAQEKTRLPGKL